MTKDFKGVLVSNRVTRIGVDCTDDSAFPLQPLYRLLRGDAETWMARIAAFVAAGNVGCYAENALNEILDDVVLIPAFYDGLICDEVDTPDDLARVCGFLNACHVRPARSR